MFCPRCGDVLTRIEDGRLMCINGQMEVTKALEKKLEECYVLKLRQPREGKFSSRIGGQWFCPQCGVLIQEQDGDLRCSSCHQTINEFIFSLVEFHPHFYKEKCGWD